MKLGNQGFGLREMIIWTCVLLIILLFVAMQINTMYKKIEENKEHNPIHDVVETPQDNVHEPEEQQPLVETIDYDYYKSLENKIKTATVNYLNENPTVLSEQLLTLTSTDLINLGYLTTLYAQDGESICSGYSNVYETNEEIVVNPYVICNNYNTSIHNGG